jgi:hypothetical protein
MRLLSISPPKLETNAGKDKLAVRYCYKESASESRLKFSAELIDERVEDVRVDQSYGDCCCSKPALGAGRLSFSITYSASNVVIRRVTNTLMIVRSV